MNTLKASRNTAFVLLCVLAICMGCASTTQVGRGRHDQFRDSLVESCRLIQSSEFERAQRQLDHSRSLAMDDHQLAKVEDLQRILQGSQAMDEGDPSSAADAWLTVRDVGLKRQLVDLGVQKGIDLRALAEVAGHEGGMKPWEN